MLRSWICNELVAAVLLCAFPAAGFSQQVEQARGLLQVQVIEPRGPVPMVEIRLNRVDAAAQDEVRSGTSDPSGQVVFAGLPAGRWLLNALRLGYESVEMPVVVAEGGRDSVTVRMRPVPQAIDTVSVSASGMPSRYGLSSIMETFYERRRRGRGRFFTREDLEESGHSNLQPILASVTGTRVRTDRVGRIFLSFPRGFGTQLGGSGVLGANANANSKMADTTSVAVHVDGIKTSNTHYPELLASLRVSDVEAIEVYRGPSELPAEAMGNSCAAVFLWTRRSVGSVLRR